MGSANTLTGEILEAAAESLAEREGNLAFCLATHGTPPMWARRPGFPTLVRIILEQQVSLASAASIFDRLRTNVVPFRPERFIELGEPHLKSLGMTRQKTAYCLELAESVITKRIRLSSLPRMDDSEARAALMQIKGIGSWSADIYLLMALRRPDIWPSSDLALATAITKLRKLKSRPKPDELSQIAEPWRPYRSVAARMLWQYYLAQ